ncbi:hypothetical protein [Sessilibacter corallicola]|uniref:Uncharacterized protein n=1 Tax=Sessilibacter corallicola TaxID=2904075 RepID=A0ABQ0ABT2_9GAMM
MILSKPYDQNRLVEFNPGLANHHLVSDSNQDECGVFHLEGDIPVALYCDSGKLILQLQNKCWDIASPNVKLNYFHDFKLAKTHFSIEGDGQSDSIEYISWWSELPGSIPLNPEEDKEEDFMAYLLDVWKNERVQKKLIDSWG